ncbi:peptide ABC transporter substrate-binding protein [Patescibacteria group bacterium]|nr:peptide ABC transporter substrate-binding protein [Patescibacteria group bacterium]
MRAFWRKHSTNAEATYRSFSASGRALFLFFAALLIVSSTGLVYILNARLLVVIPTHGGSLHEGVIGAPRFINPILAISDADLDLTSLVYSGLLRATSDGGYTPDLASDYTISPDGLIYTFHIRPNAIFQNGTPVTADDVVFTIQKTQDPELKSPKRANWVGVTVTGVDSHTVQFTLKAPYAPFIENLTLGILPKSLWQNISDDEFPFSNLNTSPIGSGPFKVSNITRTSSGIPSSYSLNAFSRYVLGTAYLDNITFTFYQNDDDLVTALKSGAVDSASGISPAALSALKGLTVDTTSLNRVFAVFFNQNQSVVLRDVAVRQALNNSIDRSALVQQVLNGYGTPLVGPVPPSVMKTLDVLPLTASSTLQASLIEKAGKTLDAAGWTMGEDGVRQKITGTGKTKKTQTLEFSLATDNVPELRAAAQYIQNAWSQLGVKVTTQIYDQGDLSENVIRPRKYDALLFGEIIGRELDLFAFWDSSQRNDPGLNIAMYANSTADKVLEQLRQTSDEGKRASLYEQFDAQLKKDIPAVFLYAPDFVYIVPKDLHGVDLGFIETPSDRFLSAALWHTDTDKVWPPFAH